MFPSAMLEWLAYHENSRTDRRAKPPETHLLGFTDLLKSARKPYSAGEASAGVSISDAELNWLCRFHNHVRNQFVHFEPMGWSIEVSGIPEIAKLVARIILEMVQIGHAFGHFDQAKRDELEKNLMVLASGQWVTGS